MDKKARTNTSASDRSKGILDNAIRLIDQNDDGKFDFSDVSEIAENVGATAKKSTQAIADGVEALARRIEYRTLRPIFLEDLDSTAFTMTKFLRVAERDRKHAESEVCRGSIGYIADYKEFPIVNVFLDSVETFGLSFYPDTTSEFYYVDPSDRDFYIAIDDYFNYLKEVRVNELQIIAQELGAKYFKITYKEEQAVFSSQKVKANVKGGPKAGVDLTHETTGKKYAKVEIEAENSFPGHMPIKPKLKYWQRETSILTLISMRMDRKSPLNRQKYRLQLNKSSGIKEKDAIKIDAVLKSLKCAGNATVASEVKNESRRFLEYEIEF